MLEQGLVIRNSLTVMLKQYTSPTGNDTRYLKWFLQKCMETGHLAAILDFPSAPKSNLTHVSYVPIYPQNFKSIAEMLLEIFSGNENQRCLPGSHIGYLISSKIQWDLRPICTNKPAKFQINFLNASWVIGQNRKSTMDIWRPFWISDRLRN